MKISLVTVSSNRTDHLRTTSEINSRYDLHDEHVILDWSSGEPVKRGDLPPDPRIKLFRIENQTGWWLTQAYNLAFSLASGSHILKLDADCALTAPLADALKSSQAVDLMCNRLTLQDWQMEDDGFCTSGAFMLSRRVLNEVKGFNPFIRGWGWDEVDLFSRVFLSGATICRFPVPEPVLELKHAPDRSVEKVENVSYPAYSPHSIQLATNSRNRLVALECIRKATDWPSLESYRESFFNASRAPEIDTSLKNVFSLSELDRFRRSVFKELLAHSFPVNPVFRTASALLARTLPIKLIDAELRRAGVYL